MNATDPQQKIEDPAAGTDTKPDNTRSDGEDRPLDPGREIGGRGGLDPTRYGDWEKAGRCIDF